MPKKILITTTSGGSGHIQAAKATQEKLLAEDPNCEIIQKELFLEWGFKRACKVGINVYNRIQRVGSVFSKETMVNMLYLADLFFGPKFFFQLVFYFIKNDFDRIIDTQPVGTASIIKAIRVYNKIRKRHLILEKIILDLPTKRTKNFFSNIKRLSNEDRKYLKIRSIEPLLEDEKTQEEFWQKHVRTSKENVIYEKYVVRKAFKDFEDKTLDEKPFLIKIQTHHSEKNATLQILKKTEDLYLFKENSLTFSLEKNDKLITVLLGSQPAVNATVGYLKNFIEVVQKRKINDIYYFFIFCADEERIYAEIYHYIMDCKNYPNNIKVILMPFQDENVIVRLFFRSNITITRSGGSTILELLTISNAKMLIHT